MGCATSEEIQLNAMVETELIVALKEHETINKLVLLGAGGSGKSTFFKQLKTIHGSGFSDGDRMPYKKHISHQLIQEMKRMISFAEETYEDDPQQLDHFAEQRDSIMQLTSDTMITTEIGKQIKILWNQPAIRHIFDERARFAITDSTGFFMDNIDRVLTKKYVPTYEDVLLCRHRTIGITDKLFVIKQTHFRIFDVGGQKAERRKWIHCFEHVEAVIYVASLSGYNEVMYEDETTNKMVDTLNLFEETSNNQWFQSTSVILFLNKSDLFADKIKSVPITCCFPDYNGRHTHDASLREIKKQFKKRNHQKERPVYIHVTCAVDKRNVEKVFDDVQHVITSSKLRGEGLY